MPLLSSQRAGGPSPPSPDTWCCPSRVFFLESGNNSHGDLCNFGGFRQWNHPEVLGEKIFLKIVSLATLKSLKSILDINIFEIEGHPYLIKHHSVCILHAHSVFYLSLSQSLKSQLDYWLKQRKIMFTTWFYICWYKGTKFHTMKQEKDSTWVRNHVGVRHHSRSH